MAMKFPKSAQYEFTKNLVKNYKIVPYLDKYFATEVTDFKFEYEPKSSDDAWHPSGDCTPSPLEIYNKVVNPERSAHPASLLKTFMVGHFWHQLLQKAVVDMEIAPAEAIEVQGVRRWAEGPYQWATGAGDIAPCSIPRFGDFVVDFKTMASHQFKSNAIPAWAAGKYEAQINIYMDFFDIDKAIIVGINKDSPHDFKEYEFTKNQPLIDRIYEKWRFVGACLEAQSPPSEADESLFDISSLYQGPVVT